MAGTERVFQRIIADHRRRRIPFHGLRAVHLLAAGFAAAASGCSSSLPSLLSDNDKPAQVARSENVKPEPSVTGSLSLANGARTPMSPLDWNIAQAALRDTLGRAEAGASQPWENPTSGSRGTVTPVAAIYERNGFACRNFLVSHVRENKENWYEGTACRIHRGQWDVTSTRPLEKS